MLKTILANAKHQLGGRTFRRLLADRDIQPEGAELSVGLSSDGKGATNIIRRYITTCSPKFPRELIQEKLLTALNEIFGPDGDFTEIQVKLHDEQQPETAHLNAWEVFLGEKRKGLIPLSRSGSGLKTIILTLLNLLVIPEIESKQKSNYVFAFEELENNLHPALLRRLFQYLEKYAVSEKASVFLTTHSSIAPHPHSLSPLRGEGGRKCLAVPNRTRGRPAPDERAVLFKPFRATSPCRICDGAGCWQALNSGFCR